jgi:hypothetical protein
MADGLQFDKAEFASASAGKVCAVCKTPITDTYFEAVGHVLCPTCAARFSGDELDPTIVGRAALYGLGAAAVGALGWHLLSRALGEWGFIAIGVGYLVGRAIRKGAGGRGGPLFQAFAVGLTYIAVAVSHTLRMLDYIDASDSVSYVKLFAGQLVAPFASGGRNIIGLVIIGIALWEAWRLTRAIPISGPFRVAPAGPPPIAEPAPPAGPSP